MPRRRYKRYLEPDEECVIPSSTRYEWRRQRRHDQNEDNLVRPNDQEEVGLVDVPVVELDVNEAEPVEELVADDRQFDGDQDHSDQFADAFGLDEERNFDSDSSGDIFDEQNHAEAEDVLDNSVGDTDGEMDFDDVFDNQNLAENEEIGENDNCDPLNMLSKCRNLNGKLCDFVNITKAEALLLVMTFSMRHSLTVTALVDLLSLINLLFGREVIPATKHMFRKVCSASCNLISYHFYCSFCTAYIAKKGDLNDTKIHCTVCQKENDVGNPRNSNFFIMCPIGPQIKSLLEDHDLVSQLNCRTDRQKIDPECIEDIYDGEIYKSHCRIGGILNDENNLSYTFGTDGSPVFRSSKYSIWPIQLMLNELPPTERQNNIILAGLWFGKGEPKMNVFLKEFTEEAKQLAEEGITFRKDGKMINSKVIGLCCCVDSVARPAMQNTTQFNGYFGCTWCYHPGVLTEGQVKYPPNVEGSDRTHKKMIAEMEEALSKGTSVKGVKGPSALINLPYFNIVWGFSPDYMHCVLLGVIRLLTNLWLESPSKKFYVGSPNDVAIIDKRLKQIAPPHETKRKPRSIVERRYWKATEWKSWLLFYSLPCLQGLLPIKYLKHLAMLVSAMFLLLKTSIPVDDVNSADILLLEFVFNMHILYGAENMMFNHDVQCSLTTSFNKEC